MKIDGCGKCDFCGYYCTGIYYFHDVMCVGCNKEYQKCMNIVSGQMNPKSPCKIKMYEDRDLTKLITVIYHRNGTHTGDYRGTRYIECLSCGRDRKLKEILDVNL